jgi:predicted nucleotidyltransferase
MPAPAGNASGGASPPEELARRAAEALAPRAEILEAYLFGSSATGAAQAHSDVDIAVYVDQGRPAVSAYGYQAELASALIAALGRNDVDLVVLNHAPPLLYHRVLRDGARILSRDLRATTTREGYALSRYCDYVPQLAKIEAARRAARAAKK